MKKTLMKVVVLAVALLMSFNFFVACNGPDQPLERPPMTIGFANLNIGGEIMTQVPETVYQGDAFLAELVGMTPGGPVGQGMTTFSLVSGSATLNGAILTINTDNLGTVTVVVSASNPYFTLYENLTISFNVVRLALDYDVNLGLADGVSIPDMIAHNAPLELQFVARNMEGESLPGAVFSVVFGNATINPATGLAAINTSNLGFSPVILRAVYGEYDPSYFEMQLVIRDPNIPYYVDDGSHGPLNTLSHNVERVNRNVTSSRVHIFEMPSIIPHSPQISRMQVEGHDVHVKDVRVNHARSFSWAAPTTVAQAAWFDFEGSVRVTVAVNGTDIDNAVVRPLAHNITPTIVGNVISFTLHHHGPFTLEYTTAEEERAYRNALHIFTNRPETEEERIDPDNIPANYFYIGPGVWYGGAMSLESGQTLYLAGGAVVYGGIRSEGVENVTIRGRGMLSGAIFHRRSDPEFTLPIEFQRSSNLTIRDISIIDPAGWAITIQNSDDVEIIDVNIITARANGDGISIQSSRNVHMTGGFVRAWDDALVVKNVVEASPQGLLSSYNILFDNVVLWVDLAQAMEVGFEAHGPEIRNVEFRNITVLYAHHLSPISINNGDKAHIHDIRFVNITVENAWMMPLGGQHGGFLINIRSTWHSVWSAPASSADTVGPINNVLIENIRVLNARNNIRIAMQGERLQSGVSNVTMRDIYIEGRRMLNLSELSPSNSQATPGANPPAVNNGFGANVNVPTITYEFTSRLFVTGATTFLPYINMVPLTAVATIEMTEGRVQGGVEVPYFVPSMPIPFMGTNMHLPNLTVRSHRYFGIGANATVPVSPLPVPPQRPASFSGDWDFDVAGHEPQNLFDGNNNTTWRSQDLSGSRDTDREFVALRFNFATPNSDGMFTDLSSRRTVGLVRIHFPETINYVMEFDIQVRAAWESAEEHGSDWRLNNFMGMRRFTVFPSEDRGAFLDIQITAVPLFMMQLQFFTIENSVFQFDYLEFTHIEFLPPPLSHGAAVTASHGYNDVYPPRNLTDGSLMTYFEAGIIGPSHVTIDLGQVHNISVISLHLPPSPHWTTRIQEIRIETATDAAITAGTTWTPLVTMTPFTFDPATGNVNTIRSDDDIWQSGIREARHVRIHLHSNSQNFGGQLSLVVIL
ncbi:MAG: glycosyl hydrolase family 28 protein [Firmicutes bacterium]|nr:glycosyl hydrolase family 28 protein [Bacillota bacterium]